MVLIERPIKYVVRMVLSDKFLMSKLSKYSGYN